MRVGYMMEEMSVEMILELNKLGYSIIKDADVGIIGLYKEEE